MKAFSKKRAADLLRPIFLLILIFSALLTLALSGCGEEAASASRESLPENSQAEPRAVFDGGKATLLLEVARTPQERARGLMNRSPGSLPPDQGMVFVFEQPTQGSFWMRNTYLPLSIAFVSATGIIVNIQDMEPLSDELHQPAAPYTHAIEANQGFFAEKGIAAGSSVSFEGL